MSRLFGNDRRRRPTRVEGTRLLSAPLGKSDKRPFFAQYWPQILTVLATIWGTVFIIGFGNRPFPYRIGELADREIRLKVDLRLANDTKTRNAREDAANATPLIFTQDPKPNAQLLDQIKNLAKAIAAQPDFDKFEPALRTEWKLTPAIYESLRSMLPNEAAVPGFIAKLDKVFAPIVRRGVLAETALPPDRERNLNIIHVQNVGTKLYDVARLDEVMLTELSRPDGILYKQLHESWSAGNDAATLFQLIVPHLTPTLTFDSARTTAETEKARNEVKTEYDEYDRGFLVVPQDTRISEEQIRLLREEYTAINANLPLERRVLDALGLIVITMALLAVTGLYLYNHEREVIEDKRRLAILCGLFLFTLGAARMVQIEPYRASFLPVAVTAFLLAVAYNRMFAHVVTFSLALLFALQRREPMEFFVVMVGGTSVGIIMLDSVRTRTKLITVGFCSAMSFSVLTIAMGLLMQQPWTLVAEDVARRFGCGMIAGFLVSGSLPFIESLFGIVTDISLIELADTSHPLLQALVQRAPGTYNHSVTVSIIAEAAAKRVGCNSLLVRVGALFHDVGKMLKPHYFIENKSANEKNRHDQLAPAMSTLIIIGHVKDGADLGRQHHLPQPIIDLIEQHHGTTLVDYFYFEATRESQASPEMDETVEESAFRYPGPRPQTKEAAVLMLSDCVESASRALSEPTPSRISKLVHNLALNRLLDGQFAESGMTLEEVKMVEDSLIKSLTSVYHGRIKYPAAAS